MDTTTERRMCDGPSSGYRRAINEIKPTRPGWTPFQNLTVYTPHPSLFHPITSTPSHLPSLFHFHTSPTDDYFHNLPNLITISYLSVLLFLVSTLPPESFPTCVFSISKVLSTMEPKKDRTYARGRSKSVAPCARLIIRSDDERDPEYMPPGTSAPSRATRAPKPHPRRWRLA